MTCVCPCLDTPGQGRGNCTSGSDWGQPWTCRRGGLCTGLHGRGGADTVGWPVHPRTFPGGGRFRKTRLWEMGVSTGACEGLGALRRGSCVRAVRVLSSPALPPAPQKPGDPSKVGVGERSQRSLLITRRGLPVKGGGGWAPGSEGHPLLTELGWEGSQATSEKHARFMFLRSSPPGLQRQTGRKGFLPLLEAFHCEPGAGAGRQGRPGPSRPRPTAERSLAPSSRLPGSFQAPGALHPGWVRAGALLP